MKMLETQRLTLKFYAKKDKADFVSLFTDDAVMKYVDKGVLTASQAEAFWKKVFEKLYPQGFNVWAVFTKEDSRYIGHASIHRRPTKKQDWEMVYFLRRDAWGKGFATEIAQRIIEYGFEELNLSKVFATVDDDHFDSIRVLEKAKMSFNDYEFDEQGNFPSIR